MREFKKTKRRKWYQVLLEFFFPDWGGNANRGFEGHIDRTNRRKRKSMFDRY